MSRWLERLLIAMGLRAVDRVADAVTDDETPDTWRDPSAARHGTASGATATREGKLVGPKSKAEAR